MNRHKILSLFSLVLFLVSFSITHAQTSYTFSTPLKLGSGGEAVRQLQITLNQNSSTQVALQGPGSPGNETTYFGPATFKAVISFQNLYYKDVVKQAGLTQATGYVGSFTLAKLNSLEGNNSHQVSNPTSPSVVTTPNVSSNITPQTLQNPTSTNAAEAALTALTNLFGSSQTLSSTLKTVVPPNTFRLFQVSPYQALPGATITLIGAGFNLDNTVYIGNSITIPHVSTTDSSHLTITLPATIPEGKYQVWVTNILGSTQNIVVRGKSLSIPISFYVTKHPKPAAHITGVSPQIVSSDSQIITLTGTGFGSSNTIHSGFGTITNLNSSDGKTLTFSLSQLSKISELDSVNAQRTTGNAPKYPLAFTFGIDNENGPGDNGAYVIIQ